MYKQYLFLLGLGALTASIKAQDHAPVDNALSVYKTSVDHQSRLYNGIEHLGYAPKIKGHAYFQESAAQNGRIVYDELVYTEVPMWYDLLKDQVIILHFNQYTRIGLISEKVTAFDLLDHHFIRIQVDSNASSPLRTGFYDVLYKGQLQVLAKRVKIINEIVKDQVERDFAQMNYYYIQKDSGYYAVKNYRSLMAFFQDRSKDIKQYLRKNKIRYRKDHENTIIKATAYYDSLTK